MGFQHVNGPDVQERYAQANHRVARAHWIDLIKVQTLEPGIGAVTMDASTRSQPGFLELPNQFFKEEFHRPAFAIKVKTTLSMRVFEHFCNRLQKSVDAGSP